jgi:hypothetical protein
VCWGHRESATDRKNLFNLPLTADDFGTIFRGENFGTRLFHIQFYEMDLGRKYLSNLILPFLQSVILKVMPSFLFSSFFYGTSFFSPAFRFCWQ